LVTHDIQKRGIWHPRDDAQGGGVGCLDEIDRLVVGTTEELRLRSAGTLDREDGVLGLKRAAIQELKWKRAIVGSGNSHDFARSGSGTRVRAPRRTM
jgi:hypothetical protein